MEREPKAVVSASESEDSNGSTDEAQVLSIIVPVFNEEEVLPKLFTRLDSVLEDLKCEVEVILVDNRSTDATRQLARQKVAQDHRYRYIRFSRNFGPSVEASITAAYRACVGDAALVLYSDLQDPPELIPRFVALWREGYDVVYGVQRSRGGERLWRRTGTRIFYRLLARMSDIPIPVDAGDFRLVSRSVITVLLAMPERARYSRGLIAWIGFEQTAIPYDREPRSGGRSKANAPAIMRTAFNGLTSFSHAPLRYLTGAGLILSSVCTVLICSNLALWLFAEPVPGMTTVVILILFGIGANVLALGLLGEYIARLQTDVKKRPLYIVAETDNLPGFPLGPDDL